MWMFFTLGAAVADAFLSGSVCAITLYSGKSVVSKKVFKSGKNNKT